MRGGKVTLIVATSTGATGNTPLGAWHVYRKVGGFDWVLYYPSYFLRGFAVHGYPDVPPYPASHGCARIPMWIAQTVYAQIAYGSTVYVYAMSDADDEVARFRERDHRARPAILAAVNRRLELVAELKRYKDEHGIAFVDPDRERSMVETRVEENDGPLSDDGLRAFYVELLALIEARARALTDPLSRRRARPARRPLRPRPRRSPPPRPCRGSA